MKTAYRLLAAAAVLATAACNGDKTAEGTADTSAPVTKVAPPADGDWSKIVTATTAGGYLMGNPEASVKLVEFGSMTCPHCREFDETGAQPLIDNYVKTGKVSYEFRNYVRDPFDLAASLIARCNGEKGFFPLTRALFADQPNWVAKIQAMSPEQQQALSSLPPAQQFVEIAKAAGFQQWAAQRGLPSSKTSQCLADEGEVNKLVQMTSDATTQYPEFPGTPAFVLNGELLKTPGTWEALEPQLRSAVGG